MRFIHGYSGQSNKLIDGLTDSKQQTKWLQQFQKKKNTYALPDVSQVQLYINDMVVIILSTQVLRRPLLLNVRYKMITFLFPLLGNNQQVMELK